MKVPTVVDMSHGDAVSSFDQAAQAGLLAVIHKATTGATGRDDAYKDRRKAAGKAKLLWGAYHWGTAAKVADQVENFLDWATPDKSTLVALDFERTGGNQMTLSQARDFLTLVASS
jgi:GH25 family lysozyme M1 (1,4-beta-N-acetylmuramidase)